MVGSTITSQQEGEVFWSEPPQGDLLSPTDSRFYSRLLSSDMDNVVDAEYLQPYKGLHNHDNQPCSTMVTTHLCPKPE